MSIIENKIFKIHAVCCVCDEPVDGRYKRGSNYYCAEDYQKESIEELRGNTQNEKIREEVKRFTKPAEEE